jgi:hypothetical protein
MPPKRKRKQAAAGAGHGMCMVCDANNIDPTSDFCSTCAVLKCTKLFESLENDTSYSTACCSAEVPDEQAECLKSFTLKEHELDELRRAVADVGLADALRDRQGDPEFQKVLEKLLSCRLSLTTRVALSVRNAQDFVNNVVEHVLTTAEKDQLEGYDVEVVDENTAINLSTNTPDATRVHLCKHDMIKGYRLKLHKIQRFHGHGMARTTGRTHVPGDSIVDPVAAAPTVQPTPHVRMVSADHAYGSSGLWNRPKNSCMRCNWNGTSHRRLASILPYTAATSASVIV